MDAPIPGENWTSDTRGQPWHRPPDMSGYDEIIENILQSLKRKQFQTKIISMVDAGLPIAFVVSFILMKGVGEGKWSIDMAIIVAGPVAHFLAILARSYEIPVKLGIDVEMPKMTGGALKMMAKRFDPVAEEQSDYISEEEVTESPAEQKKKSGFAAAATDGGTGI